MNLKLLRYALFGLPLGFVGLPLYIHLPKFYADTMPISLSAIGSIMFFTRIADCFADPFIGYYSDKYQKRKYLIVIASCILISAGVFLLFLLPEILSGNLAMITIAILLAVTYFSYSFLSINFYSSGIALSTDYSSSTKVSALREGSIIVGVIFASALPQLLISDTLDEKTAYKIFAFVFISLLFLAFLFSSFSSLIRNNVNAEEKLIWKQITQDKELSWVFAVFFLNAIPPSITATLFLFYVSDILNASSYSGVFLGIYFVSAVFAMPFWAKFAANNGKKNSLYLSMLLAITSFVWAYGLNQNDISQFTLICILSGIALGGDLAVLPSILSDVLNKNSSAGSLEFGIWNFISKFTLALSAGVALPMLEFLGYKPNSDDIEAGKNALSISYGLLPCIFKFLALTILFLSPLDRKKMI